MKCNKLNCQNDAKYQLGWRAWATGHGKDTVPLVGYVGLAVCEDHKKVTTLEQITSPEGNARINTQLAAMGKAQLDFSQGEIVFHDLLDGKLFMPGGNVL